MKESPDQSVRVFLFEEVFFNAESAEKLCKPGLRFR